MSAFVAFTSFSLFWLALTLFGLPWARRVVASFSKDDHPSGFATVALAPALGITFFLLVFSWLGRVIPAYALTLVATFLVLGAFVYVLRRFLPRTDQLLTVRDFSPLLFLVVFQFAMWLPRPWFSDIHYDSGMYGAEKLFNLSLQQSFTYGSGYPPQSTWLVGEPEVYYILPRLLPGLATHFAVNFAGV